MTSKSIETLVQDIQGLFKSGKEFNKENISDFGQRLAEHLSNRISDNAVRSTNLWLSNLGTKCTRQLWYKINRPDLAEELPPEAHMKFLFGDILEELLLFLAKEAGHTVEGQQDELNIEGISGHRDAVIDGILVDTKSASSRSFTKFESHLTPDVDDFGYLTQLQGYLEGGKDDPKILDKDIAAFLVVDKQLGKITLDIHAKEEIDWKAKVNYLEKMARLPDPPPRAYEDKPDGKSGNRKLGTACAYCSFKKHCWPGLKVYFYSNGPRFLTVVKREPKVERASDEEE